MAHRQTIIGPALAGLLAERFGYVAMWRYQIIPFFVAIAIIFFSRGRMAKIGSDFLAREEGKA